MLEWVIMTSAMDIIRTIKYFPGKKKYALKEKVLINK